MLEASQGYHEQKKVDRILYNFRHQKRASKTDTRNLEDKLLESWNSNHKISREDYSSILKQNAKYLVDYVTEDAAGKVSEHLLNEISRLYGIGLTKNQISEVIRKNKADTIENIVKNEEWHVAIDAIHSKNARLKASKLRKNNEEIRNYLESKTDWRTAKTIANKAKTKETADNYLQKYQEVTEYLKNLGYKTKIKTIAGKAFTAKDHIKKAEKLANEYDSYLNSFFEINALYTYYSTVGWINAVENLNFRKEKSKVKGDSYQDVHIEESNLEEPIFRIREEIKNKGFEPLEGILPQRNKKILETVKEKVKSIIDAVKLKVILKKYGYSDIEKEIIDRGLNNKEKFYAIRRDLKFYRESKDFAKRYVDETTASSIAAAVLRMQPSDSIDKRLPESKIEITNVPSLPAKHIRDTNEGIMTYREFMKYCEGRNREIGKNIAIYSVRVSKSLDKERLKQNADTFLSNYDAFLNYFKNKNYGDIIAKRIAHQLFNKRFDGEKVEEYEQIFIKTSKKAEEKFRGIDKNTADYIASDIFSKNFNESNAKRKYSHFRNSQDIETGNITREFEKKIEISEKAISEAMEKYRPQYEKYMISNQKMDKYVDDVLHDRIKKERDIRKEYEERLAKVGIKLNPIQPGFA